MYTTDLATILQLLREFRRTGILRTEIPAGLPRLKQPCFIVVELLRGEVNSCHVKDSKGQDLLAGQEAFKAISSAGKQNWIFDSLFEQELMGGAQRWGGVPEQTIQTPALPAGPSQMPPVLPGPPWQTRSLPQSPVPRRLLQLSQAQINSWPRRYRQIYVLIDGVRGVDKIAAILSQPPQIVEDVLREMQAIGAVILQER